MKVLSRLQSWVVVLITILIIFWSFWDQKPTASFMDSDDPAAFSITNVVDHLKIITKDVHHVGAPAHGEVQDYLIAELQKLGLTPEVQKERVFGLRSSYAYGTVPENIVAKIKGTTPGKALLLLSHYDSALPHAKGASDDGSGIATILEGLRVFLANKQPPKNDIVILFSDAEELGLLGARAFIEKHPLADDIGLVLNFEARGSGGPSIMLMETNGKNSALLSEFIKANTSYPTTNSMSYSIYKMLPNDTDLTPFREVLDVNGFNFAFIDDHFDYHTEQDSWQRINRASLVHQADYFMNTVNYFANSNLKKLDSNEDHVFANFPIIKLLYYPFSWNIPLFIFACLLLILLTFLGFRKKKINLKNAIKAALPFLISLVGSCIINFGLWQILLYIHPQYNDIIQGFTYNGHTYITAFTLLNIGSSLFVYKKWLEKYSPIDLLLFPLLLWIVFIGLLIQTIPGAGFLILPVFMALIVLTIMLFDWFSLPFRFGLFLCLSIPLLYFVAPTTKILIVGLGLEMLAISAFFSVMAFGLFLPILAGLKIKKTIALVINGLAFFFFVIASITSGFNEDRKKPNNITYYLNADNNTAYWVSSNHQLDPFLSQFLGQNPEKGGLPKEANYPNSRIRFHKKTENKTLKVASIKIENDTLIGEKRQLDFSILPNRKLHQISLRAKNKLDLKAMSINGTAVKNIKKPATSIQREQNEIILRYTLSATDQKLHVSLTLDNKMPTPSFYIEEVSFDLLENKHFSIEPRTTAMMPFAFIVGDAILTKQSFDLKVVNH